MVDFISIHQLYYLTFFFIISIVGNYIYVKKYPKKVLKQSRKIPNPKIIASEGGLVFFVLFFIFFYFIYNSKLFEINLNVIPRFYVLFISLVILCIISYIDDKFFISKKTRFLIQIIFTYLSLSSLNLPIFNFLPEKVEYLFLVFLWVYLINTSNFIDGLNGMLASNCIIFLLGCLIIIDHYQIIDNYILTIILLLFILTSAFLLFNFPKAYLFIGDTGSIPLGFLIGYIIIYFFSLEIFWPVFFLFVYPLVDVSITLIDKVFIRRKLPWERLFDYFFLMPVIHGGKNHSFVIFRVFFVNASNLLLLKLFLVTNNYFVIFLPFITSAILINYFRSFKI